MILAQSHFNGHGGMLRINEHGGMLRIDRRENLYAELDTYSHRA